MAYASVSGAEEMDLPPSVITVTSVTTSVRRSLATVSGIQVKVGSVGVTPRGAVAWIECPESNPALTAASPSPNCTVPGRSVNHVIVAASGSAPTEVASGSDADPVSLRVTDSGVVHWIQGGQRRSVPLVK